MCCLFGLMDCRGYFGAKKKTHILSVLASECEERGTDATGIAYCTHGHLSSPKSLPALAEGTVFLSGHTHVKIDQMENGVRCINPGSVSIPKDGSHSCMILENGCFRTVVLGD